MSQNFLNASRIYFIYKCKQIHVLITMRHFFFVFLVFYLLNSQILSLPLTILVRERQVHLFFMKKNGTIEAFTVQKSSLRERKSSILTVTIFVSLFPVNLLVRFCHSYIHLQSNFPLFLAWRMRLCWGFFYVLFSRVFYPFS